MPKHLIAKPTNIYWLYDMRPETVAAFGADGQPFYCGKTVYSVEKRLSQHRRAANQRPHSNVSPRVLLCGDDIRTVTIETVAATGDWIAREQFWIRTLRQVNPDCANVTDGGTGALGIVISERQREAIGEANRKREITDEYRSRLSESHKNMTPETRERLSVASRNKKLSTDHKQKLHSGNRKYWNRKGKGNYGGYFLDAEFDQ